jgi:energy-coupling factor transport system ATP-binding protein
MSIEIKNLNYVYSPNTPFEKKALNNIDITIKKGEFIGLIGHTGSGKSTLIQTLNALIKPTSGQILIDGVDIHSDKKQLRALREKVGIVFQYPEHQLFEMTIYKDVAFAPTNMGLSKDEIDFRVKNSLDLVGIDKSMYEKSPFEISGGQKRRVAIAGILAMKPQILILDEPTAGLDPRGRDEILLNIKKLHKELGLTIILVSHSMEDISVLVDRIIVMDKGNVFCTGSPDTVFSKHDELAKIGLSSPQITHLMCELKKKGFDVPTNVFTIEDATKILFDIFK